MSSEQITENMITRTSRYESSAMRGTGFIWADLQLARDGAALVDA